MVQASDAEIVNKPFHEGHKDLYKGKWPRAARNFFIRLFLKGKCSYKDFYKGNWPRAARKCFEIVVH